MKYVQGNVLEPIGKDRKLIIHCCNDIGAWGAGFVVPLAKKWPDAKEQYKLWKTNTPENNPFTLGFIQTFPVEHDIAIVNMIGQHKCGHDENGFSPIRYWAIDECLKKVAVVAKKYACSIHLPYLMGCGLAGGEWDYIEMILTKRLINQGIAVTAYDIDGKR